MRIDGLTAVVTGGASGLGEATVRMFVQHNAKVVILDVTEEAGKKIADELGENAIFVLTDVTSEESVKNALDIAVKKFGEVHVAVNCAGIAVGQKVLGKNGPSPLNLFEKAIRINLTGSYNVLRLAAGKMTLNMPNEEGERGVIINTASVAAFEGQIGQAAYSASKGGIVGMILPIARELAAYGIRVMGIAPGVFETPMVGGMSDNVRNSLGMMTPFPSRFGKPAEYALLVRSIVENPMLNGTTIRLDGAIRMQPK
ncbi:3-hydroxyacyl-CoA dehydrogenase [Desulfotomaculum copahuensis]|uniref:3-hydroxy-2-methylbutyryl-CoA dehydrogenase n=1 Tax=Desulfotomaculum copahuensis TaxID=1838280 RepID=A0A1B7LDT6_9FIRM|nr:3-hydroxyacyl-CoA dehydrogenase [Desulfotomaculum copahuensis]OAT81224.1 3-hydroxy-2-methylbutyryl-CoA dehydrogenase [Desulfotomaculum copahuensis]